MKVSDLVKTQDNRSFIVTNMDRAPIIWVKCPYCGEVKFIMEDEIREVYLLVDDIGLKMSVARKNALQMPVDNSDDLDTGIYNG